MKVLKMVSMSDVNALDLQSGQMVGGYTLIDRLGGGAMGSVWRVRDDGGQTYAMKILRDSLKEETDDGPLQEDVESAGPLNGHMTPAMRRNPRVTARERLRREALALRKVQHPGVCSIVDMELDDSLAFIVTELIEGRNLRDDVNINGRYEGEDLELLARKLISAVRAVHAQGIIHRDIKPTNVMVSATGPVLVDFGIAMAQGESHVTRTGLVMGTPGFIAPEIIDGDESDEATDWWSLASVLAFAATGKPVFGDKPMMAVLEREAAGSADLSGLPPRTLSAFRQALSPIRTKRCSPEQLLETIEADATESNGWTGGDAAFPFDSSAPDHHSGAGHDAAAHRGMAGENSDGNPRIYWNDDDTDVERAAPMRPGHDDAPTSTTQLLPIEDRDTALVGTQILPKDDMPDVTTAFPMAPVTNDTVVMPVDTPAPTLAMPGRTTIMPPTDGQPYASTEDDLGERRDTLPPAVMPQSTENPTSLAAGRAGPRDPSDLMAQVSADTVVSVRRQRLLSRSVLPACLIAIPIAMLASAYPMLASIAASTLIWFLTTLGLSEQAQLAREEKHGGTRRGGDFTRRCLEMPWHALKGLAFSIPQIALNAVIALAVPVIIELVLGLPHSTFMFPLGSQSLPVPVFANQPLSSTGVTQVVCAAASWLLVVFVVHGGHTLRIGAGYLRGDCASQSSSATKPWQLGDVPVSSNVITTAGVHPDPLANAGRQDVARRRSANRWGFILLVIWFAITLLTAATCLTADHLTWFPL